WKAREYGQHTRFIELAGEINTRMPEHIVHRVADALNTRRKAIKGSKILILGLAYKPNVDDERESPSYVLMKLLTERGAEVAYYDPYVPVIKPTREHPQFAGRKSVQWHRATIENFDDWLLLYTWFGLSLPEDPWEKLLALLAIIIVWPLVLGGHASRNAEMNGRFVLASRVSPPQGRTVMVRSGGLVFSAALRRSGWSLISRSGETSMPNPP